MKLTARFPFRTIACLILAGQALMAHDPHDPMQAVAVSPNFANDQTVFAATGVLSLKFGIYVLLKSTDGGVIWTAVQGMNNDSEILQIVFSPAYALDNTIYVAGLGGIFMSTNQGASWTQLTKLAVVNVALSANFGLDNTMFAVTNERSILMSTNRGTNFTFPTPPTSLTAGLTAIAISPNFDEDQTLLLGGLSNGIFLSTNGGSIWTPVTSGQTVSQVSSLAFSPNFTNDHTAFAGTFGTGVFLSTSAGTSWAASNSGGGGGITDLNVTSLELSPTYQADSTVWVTTAVAGVFQSNNSAAAWTLDANVSRTLSGLTTVHYQALAPASGGANATLFLAMYEGLWTSNNSAQSWLYIDTLPTRLIRHVNLSPNYAEDQTLFASTYGGGNLWSTNGGSTWTIMNTGMQLSYTDASAISPNFAKDGTAFSSNYVGLQGTTTRGTSWNLLQGLGPTVDTYPRALAVSPAFATDMTVFIGLSVEDSGPTTNTGVYLSTDGGAVWSDTSLSQVAGVISIAVSPGFATDQTAFAASPTNGLYKSTNGGTTWTQLTLPPNTSAEMALVAVTPTFVTDQTVFAAGISGGIFKSTNGGSNSTSGGSSFTLLSGTTTLRALDMQVSPNWAKDQTLYAGTLQKGFLKFTNGGTKIVDIPFPDVLVTAIGLSPRLAKDHTIFAAGYHGLYKSTNSGSAWTNTAEPARMEESRQANSTYAPQNPPSIIYQGLWSGINPSVTASTNAYMATSETNDTAVLNFTGDGVRWVGWVGPTQGMAAITLDGVPQTTVNLCATLNDYQVTIWQLQGLTCGLHSLTITALPPPTSGCPTVSGNTISVDAFDVWVNTCPLP